MELSLEKRKLPLYYYDEYQTYDLLWIDEIDPRKHNFWGFLFEQIAHGILIERFFPHKCDYPKEWGVKIFNALSPLASTAISSPNYPENAENPRPFLLNDALTGFKLSSDYTGTLLNDSTPAIRERPNDPLFTDIYDQWQGWNNPYIFTGDFSINIPEGFTGKIRFCYYRNVVNFNVAKYEYTIDFLDIVIVDQPKVILKFGFGEYFTPFSLITTFDEDNEEWNNKLKSINPAWLFYSNLDQYLANTVEYFSSECSEYGQILKSLTIKATWENEPIGTSFLERSWARYGRHQIIDYELVAIPQNKRKSAYIFANNNVWEQPDPPTDIWNNCEFKPVKFLSTLKVGVNNVLINFDNVDPAHFTEIFNNPFPDVSLPETEGNYPADISNFPPSIWFKPHPLDKTINIHPIDNNFNEGQNQFINSFSQEFTSLTTWFNGRIEFSKYAIPYHHFNDNDKWIYNRDWTATYYGFLSPVHNSYALFLMAMINPYLIYGNEPSFQILQVDKYFSDLFIPSNFDFPIRNDNKIMRYTKKDGKWGKYYIAFDEDNNLKSDWEILHNFGDEDNEPPPFEYTYTVSREFSNSDPYIYLTSTIEDEITKIDAEYHYATNEEGELIKIMPDSPRIKEIHASLDASKFSKDDNDPNKARVANLGYLLERLARVLGISVNSDGSIRSIRQKSLIPDGGTIPEGYSLGQFGIHSAGISNPLLGQVGGESTEKRDGIVYEIRSNTITKNEFNGEIEKVDQGGYLLCENLPQYLDALLDDLDKALGWEELGSMIVPAHNKEGYVNYEGLGELLSDLIYSLSDLSRNIKQTHILTIENRKIIGEIISALGLPVEMKSSPININNQTGAIAYPAINENAPTIYELYSDLLLNIGLINARGMRTNNEKLED